MLGIFIREQVYRENTHPALELLKQQHFPHNPDEPVVFHRRDIIDRKGSFWRLRDSNREKSFNKDLLSFLSSQEYHIIGVVIDKKRHIERHGTAAFHPYHYCIAAMLERYCGFLNFYSGKGDVLVESRGGKENKQLKEAYKRIYYSGTYYHPDSFFQNTLTSNEIKLKPKSSNIAGLQLADLLAYPVKQSILIDNKKIGQTRNTFSDHICRHIEGKYNRQIYQNRISGYGKIFL